MISLGKIFFAAVAIGTFSVICRAQEIKKNLTNERNLHLQVDLTERSFWCPTCQHKSQETCDANLKNTTCPKARFCMALWDENIFVRKCVNEPMLKIFTTECKTGRLLSRKCVKKMTHEFSKRRDARNERPKNSSKMLDFAIKHCKQQNKCHVRSCNETGCKAEGRKPVVPPFQCPTCPVTKSSQACDVKMEMTQCPKAGICMALRVKLVAPGRNLFTRKCVNNKMFTVFQEACEKKKGCEITSCATSGCKAAFKH